MDTSVNETSEMDKSLVAGASVNTTSTTASGNHESSASATMTGTPQPPDAETMKMLESYSDMMAEMVAAKMMKKMEK